MSTFAQKAKVFLYLHNPAILALTSLNNGTKKPANTKSESISTSPS